jgi:alpha-beta hydrolase superfamily lysophospholipase
MRWILSFLLRNKTFAFETLRAAGSAPYDGADLGEVLATARAIRGSDEESWLQAWQATADRVRGIAEEACANGHVVSARNAYLRASNYYRSAEFFRRAAPATDPDVAALSDLSRRTFVKATRLMDRPVEQLAIPYEDTTLPGDLFLVDDSGRPRPTVIYTNGYDSTAEESWFAVGAAALERGYHVLAYDGPGQGAVIRNQGLLFRPDWEAVLGPVLDLANARAEIDSNALVHFGYSMGAYLVARSAAYDHRPAALILNDGIYDFHQAYVNEIPAFLMRLIYAERDAVPNAALTLMAKLQTQVRWGLNNGLWTIGGASYADFIRRTTDYHLRDVAGQIVAPTLILDAEEDQFLKGQPEMLAKAMSAPRTLARLTSAEGAGEHCHVGSLARTHQVSFDWLDTTLGTPERQLTAGARLVDHQVTRPPVPRST